MSQYDFSAEGLGLTPGTFFPALKGALAEGIGVLLFVFLGAGTVVVLTASGGLNLSSLLGIAFAHGLALAALVAATARISGGHINPAVSIAAVVTGRMRVGPGVLYVGAQLIGAAAGALLLEIVIADEFEGTLGAHVINDQALEGDGSAVVLEAVMTFALVFVIFATAFDPRSTVAAIAPLAIGFTVLADHFIGVPLTGASMNPARSFGPALVANEWADHWIYWAGPVLGATLAGMVYMLAFWEREEPLPDAYDDMGADDFPDDGGSPELNDVTAESRMDDARGGDVPRPPDTQS